MEKSTDSIAVLLREHSLRELFIEKLGWDRFGTTLSITVHDRSYELTSVAHKRGLSVIQCMLDRLELRDRLILRAIQRNAAKYAHENLVIYIDSGRGRRVWQWARAMENGRVAVLIDLIASARVKRHWNMLMLRHCARQVR